MKPLRFAQLLALSELVSALLLPGAYLFPFQYGFRAENWYHPALLLGSLLSVLFVAVPAAALIGLLRGRLASFWGLYVSPILSFALGVSAIPLVAYTVPRGAPRTVLVGITNVAAIAFAIWLRTRMSSRLLGAMRAIRAQGDA